MIREATARDAEAICGIYNPYIRNSIISFEETDVPVREMTERLEAVTSTLPWLVVARAGRVAGYAYASKWHGRAAYRHSVETTIYVEEAARGRGLGSELYFALLDRLRAMPFRTGRHRLAECGERCPARKMWLQRVASKAAFMCRRRLLANVFTRGFAMDGQAQELVRGTHPRLSGPRLLRGHGFLRRRLSRQLFALHGAGAFRVPAHVRRRPSGHVRSQ